MKKFKVSPANSRSDNDLIGNIIWNHNNLPSFIKQMRADATKPVWIFSGGPSLKKRLDEGFFKKEDFEGCLTMAVKHAVPALNAHGIVADYVINVDPRPIENKSTHNLVRKDLFSQVPKESKVLIASQSDPSLYEYLKDTHECIGWDALINVMLKDSRVKNLIETPVIGGTCSALRAAQIAYLWGFRRIRLVGVDSSYMPYTPDMKDNIDDLTGGINDPFIMTVKGPDDIVYKYVTTGELVAQYQDMQNFFSMPDLPYELKLVGTWHGDSLMGTLLDTIRNMTLKPQYDPNNSSREFIV